MKLGHWMTAKDVSEGQCLQVSEQDRHQGPVQGSNVQAVGREGVQAGQCACRPRHEEGRQVRRARVQLCRVDGFLRRGRKGRFYLRAPHVQARRGGDGVHHQPLRGKGLYRSGRTDWDGKEFPWIQVIEMKKNIPTVENYSPLPSTTPSSTASSPTKTCSRRRAPKSRRLRWTPDDIWVIMYTGGTTGKPKGVMKSHASPLRAVLHHDLRPPVQFRRLQPPRHALLPRQLALLLLRGHLGRRHGHGLQHGELQPGRPAQDLLRTTRSPSPPWCPPTTS